MTIVVRFVAVCKHCAHGFASNHGGGLFVVATIHHSPVAPNTRERWWERDTYPRPGAPVVVLTRLEGGREPVSIKLMTQVWELSLPKADRLVLLALADHAHDDGRTRPGVPYLVWKTELDRRTVQRILRKLQEEGLIRPLRNEAGGRGLATDFLLTLDKGTKKPPFRPEPEEQNSGVVPPFVEEARKKGGVVPPITAGPSKNSGVVPPFTGPGEDEKAASRPQKGGILDKKGGTTAAPTKSKTQEVLLFTTTTPPTPPSDIYLGTRSSEKRETEPRSENPLPAAVLDRLRVQLAERDVSEAGIDHALEQLALTASYEDVKNPLRYCLRVARARPGQRIPEPGLAEGIKTDAERRLEDARLDEEISLLPESERTMLRELAETSLDPLARVEPAVRALMRQRYQERRSA